MKTILEEIKTLKKEKDAVILAHYYVPDEIQQVADIVGDSFYLSCAAKNTQASTIVFAGVSFMGESAKLLNPEKTVLLPDETADCPMAHMASEQVIEAMRKKYDDLAVVCYINSTAKLKAIADVCVTSSNAVKIVRALDSKNIYFIPDKNLANYVAKQVPEKNIIPGGGFCPVHNDLTAEALLRAKNARPEALVLVHPECVPEVSSLADFTGSTSEILNFAQKSTQKEFLIGTECGVLYELRRDNPDKRFYPIGDGFICHDMKKVTPEAVRDCLKYGRGAVEIGEKLRVRAMLPLDRMLKLGK